MDCGGSCPAACPNCGDGTLQPPEECDTGNTVAGDGCDATCMLERCGDSITNNGPPGNAGDAAFGARGNEVEQCDDGNTASGDGCSSTCVVEVPPVGQPPANQPPSALPPSSLSPN
eukprot:gene12782-biopygen8693